MKKMLSITLIYLTATLLFCETSFAYIGYNDVYITYNFSDTVTFHRGEKSSCYFGIGMGQAFWTNCNDIGTFKGWTNIAYSAPLICGNIASTDSIYTLIYPGSGDYQDTIYMHYTSIMWPQACIPSKVFIQIPPEGTSCRSNFWLETAYGSHTVILNEQAIVTAPDSIVNYEWSFGDGSFSNEPNPIHTYSDFGDYEVCLTVTTAAGHQHTNCRNFRLFIYPIIYVGNFEATINATSPFCYGNFVWNETSSYSTTDIFRRFYLTLPFQPDSGVHIFPFSEILQPDWETCSPWYYYDNPSIVRPSRYRIKSLNRYGAFVSTENNLPALPTPVCNIDFSLSVDSNDSYTIYVQNLSESTLDSYSLLHYALYTDENQYSINSPWSSYTVHFECGGEKTIKLSANSTTGINCGAPVIQTILLPLAADVSCHIEPFTYIENVGNNPKKIRLYPPDTYVENYDCDYSEDSITWSFGDGETITHPSTSSPSSQIHTYADYGVYNVCCTIDIPSLSCSPSNCQTIAIFPVATNQPENGVPLCKILPGGAVYNSATLHIEQPDQLPALLTLFDLSGKVAWQQTIVQTPTQLELSQLPSGVYITHLQHKNYTWQTKLVKM